LYNGQPSELLLPAKAFSYASVLLLQSITADTAPQRLGYRASVKTGSWGYYNPALQLRLRQGKWQHLVSAEWQKAKGDYPFKAYENNTDTKRRNNADVQALRAEYGTQYQWKGHSKFFVNTYYYQSERGLPGAVILFNDAGRERLWDNQFFVQLGNETRWSAKSRMLLQARYNYVYNRYLNPDFANSQGYLENIFRQHEYYLSGAYAYRPVQMIELSYATDYTYSTLRRTDVFAANFSNPNRNTWLHNAAAKLQWQRIELVSSLLFTHQQENVQTGAAAATLNKFTPTIAISYQPWQQVPLHVRGFYKKIFRAPTFNDLYYTYIGNTALRPEYVTQYNMGITWGYSGKGALQMLALTADAYYNRVKDKILAIPRQNLYQWSMQNIGLASIKGLDVGLQLQTRQWNSTSLQARASYSLQQALDVTDPASPAYNRQLPYTPRHSGSVHVAVLHKGFTLGYNVVWSAYRYREGDQTKENLLKQWATHDVTLRYSLLHKAHTYTWLLELNNIFNQRYDIVMYYPMPGLQYRAGVAIQL
jgi:outer membrane cobalamin receptor